MKAKTPGHKAKTLREEVIIPGEGAITASQGRGTITAGQNF